MAKFGQAFINQLTNPSYSQGMFNLGATIGSAPAIAAEKEEKKNRLARIDQSFIKADQGVAAAQQGDVDAITKRIQEIRKIAADPNVNLEEKKLYRQELQSLRGMMPAAAEIQTKNKASAIYKAEEALTSGQLDSITDPVNKKRVEDSLRIRIEEMKRDPEALQEYNKFKVEKFRMDKLEKEMQSEAWLNTNATKIKQAIQEGNLGLIDTLGKQAEDNGYFDAFQTYLTTASNNQVTLDKIKDRSLTRSKKPNFDYQDEIDNLPEEFRPLLQSRFDAYKKVAEAGWDGKVWKEGQRTRSVQLENDFIDTLSRVQLEAASSAFRKSISDENKTEEREYSERLRRENLLTQAEVEYRKPVTPREINAELVLIAKNPKKPTEAEKQQALQNAKNYKLQEYRDTFFYLDPNGAREKFGYPDPPQAAISALQDDPTDDKVKAFQEKFGYVPDLESPTEAVPPETVQREINPVSRALAQYGTKFVEELPDSPPGVFVRGAVQGGVGLFENISDFLGDTQAAFEEELQR